MEASSADHPHLRLVGGRIAAGASRAVKAAGSGRPRDEADHVATVASENRRAAANPELKPTDPRWVLAVRAYSQLQGTTLTPDRRKRVLKSAQQLGVRPFDANVIIAIVQDHARTGRSLGDAAPTLQLLHQPPSADGSPYTTRWLAAMVAAAALNFLLIWWILAA